MVRATHLLDFEDDLAETQSYLDGILVHDGGKLLQNRLGEVQGHAQGFSSI